MEVIDLAKQRKKTRGQKKTNVDRFEYNLNGKSKRQQGIDRKIINAFKQSEMKKTIKTDKGNTNLKCVLRIASWITKHCTEELKQAKLSDPSFWKGYFIDKFFEYREKQFWNGEITADTFKKDIHAIEMFRQAANTTSAFGDKKIRIGNHDERRNYYKERGTYTSNREITASKVNLEQVSVVHNQLEKNYKEKQKIVLVGDSKNQKRAEIRAHNAEVAYHVNKFQSIFATRVTATLNTVAKNITFDEKTNSIFAKQEKDKNDFTRTVVERNLSQEDFDYVKNLVGNKTGGQSIFELKDNEGKTMNPLDARKEINKLTKEAAKECGMYRKDARFNTHSNRKAAAQAMYDQTKRYSKSKIQSMITDYLSHQGSNAEQIRARLKKELRRVNKYRLENGLPKRSFTREELRVLYVSLLLGHSRQSVVKRNYIITDKERAKMEKEARHA